MTYDPTRRGVLDVGALIGFVTVDPETMYLDQIVVAPEQWGAGEVDQLSDLWAYIQALPKSPLPKDIPLLAQMLNEK